MNKNNLMFAILDAQAANEGLVFTTGVIDLTPEGYGFLRSAKSNYISGPSDIYVSKAQVKKFHIKQGNIISGPVRSPKKTKILRPHKNRCDQQRTCFTCIRNPEF